MASKATFVLYKSYLQKTERLSDEQLGVLFRAILRYESGMELPKMDALAEMAFDFIRVDLDANEEKYAEQCEKNRCNAKKRWDAKDTTACDRMQSDAKDATACEWMPNDTDTDSGSDSGSDSESGNETESDNDSLKTSCGKRSKNRSPLEPEADTAAIPLNDGSAWRPPMSLYETYEQSYPAVDLPQEFNKMRSWCLSNPKNCKTRSGVKRFVNNWLIKAQDHAARQPNGRASPYQHSNTDVLLSIINGGG